MADLQPSETVRVENCGYGTPAFDWSRACDQLAAGRRHVIAVPYFLGTVGPGGVPHAAGVGAMWHDGDLYFTSGPGTAKARNLAANPACTISARLDDLDLTLTGRAARVT